MPSYVVTGANRGLGAEFLKQMSSDPKNIVVGLVRDKAAAEKDLPAELKSQSNIYFLEADITNQPALKKAAEDTAKITGGGLDYLIANAGLINQWDRFSPIGTLASDPERLEQEMLDTFRINAIGNIHLISAFMPLVLRGQVKKVIVISTGMSDLDVTAEWDLELGSVYSISKAALNMAVTKFSAQYKKDGVLVMSICPGTVDTGVYNDATPEQQQALGAMFQRFQEYAPHFKGPVTPEYSVKRVMDVVNKSSVAGGNGGTFVSHLGTKQWL